MNIKLFSQLKLYLCYGNQEIRDFDRSWECLKDFRNLESGDRPAYSSTKDLILKCSNIHFQKLHWGLFCQLAMSFKCFDIVPKYVLVSFNTAIQYEKGILMHFISTFKCPCRSLKCREVSGCLKYSPFSDTRDQLGPTITGKEVVILLFL